MIQDSNCPVRSKASYPADDVASDVGPHGPEARVPECPYVFLGCDGLMLEKGGDYG